MNVTSPMLYLTCVYFEFLKYTGKKSLMKNALKQFVNTGGIVARQFP